VNQVRDLTIGQAARLAGVTPKALRHYDQIGLLRPAEVDPATGYRRYHGEQVERARLIRRLRDLELPLDEIRRLLDLDEAALTEALRAHRRRIDARVTRLRGVLHTLDHLLADTDWSTMSESDPTPLTPAQHRRLGVNLFNDAWRLMEKEDRSADEDALLLATTHASYYHWLHAEASPAHAARGEWQVSRVYCVLERAEPALHHARRVLEICQANGIDDWDLAFAYEALARACAVGGEYDEARRWLEQARLATVDIAEDDDRDVVLADLETIPLPPKVSV
jgi:DNA-binding transcriptional MerR regulator